MQKFSQGVGEPKKDLNQYYKIDTYGEFWSLHFYAQ